MPETTDTSSATGVVRNLVRAARIVDPEHQLLERRERLELALPGPREW